jgi:hypothetical protein
MRWRKLLARVAVLCLVAVLLTAALLAFWPETAAEPTRVTKENLHHLRRSMVRGVTSMYWYEGTRTQVEAVLGPPGDYRTQPGTFDSSICHVCFPPGTGRNLPLTELVWLADTIEIHVVVDASDNVVGIGESNFKYISTASEWERFCWVLKRRWHRWFP